MYYNQNNYPHVPYPAPGYGSATLQSAGCGPCCAAMVAEGLTGQTFPPQAAAQLAMESGARLSGGTSMAILGAALARRFGLALAKTDKPEALTACLKSGGWAVANVGGNRSGYTGLFSDGGHYVTVCGLEADGRLVVWDPGYYSGKLDKAGRRGRATVRGHDILVTAGELERDCLTRSPGFYLFTGTVNTRTGTEDTAPGALDAAALGDSPPGAGAPHRPSPWAAEAWERAVAAGVLDGTLPQSPLTREQLAVVLARLGLL